VADEFRSAIANVDRILKGEKPAGPPRQSSNILQLLLAVADEVIE
jgi:hypothetical protein